MIEKIILDFLNDGGLTAWMELPETYPSGAFAIVSKTGGGKTNHLSRALVAVQSYGPTLYEAAQMNERVKARMEQLPELDRVTRAEPVSDYIFTDTAAKRYRYQAVFQVYYYD